MALTGHHAHDARPQAQPATHAEWRVGATFARFFTRRSLSTLDADECKKLIEGQVEATRPIISGLIASGAMILALTGMFEAFNVAPWIGWPWWIVELVALTIAGSALAIWHLGDWRPRLLLTVLSTLLFAVFLSIPVPDGRQYGMALRMALYSLMPIALLALMVRRVSILALSGTMLFIAWLRVFLHGELAAGSAVYWLYNLTTIGIGLLLGGYRTDFAVSNFRMRQRLRYQATTDELTGLRNRAGWNRDAELCYEEGIKRAKPASFAFFDIDYFKRVNDTHGHAIGDRTLQQLGQIIRERLGARCCAARMGGEEFVVLLVDYPAESVEGFVQRVRKEFADATRDVGVTVSAGVAHRLEAESMSQHLRRADVALYEAKAEGRDRMVVAKG
jgi:diguanylate cyclase (GGDEF)-like protein